MESTTSSISLQAALQWMPMTTTTTKNICLKKNEQEQPNNIKLSTMTHIQPLPHILPQFAINANSNSLNKYLIGSFKRKKKHEGTQLWWTYTLPKTYRHYKYIYALQKHIVSINRYNSNLLHVCWLSNWKKKQTLNYNKPTN